MSKKTDASDAVSDNKLTPEVDFEAALAELESLVEQMEGGNMSLDASLKAFERGIALTRQCQSALQAAELKVQALTDDGDLVDFDAGEVDEH